VSEGWPERRPLDDYISPNLFIVMLILVYIVTRPRPPR
jgi:hypothetical protein